jgi:hypothetical protein
VIVHGGSLLKIDVTGLFGAGFSGQPLRYQPAGNVSRLPGRPPCGAAGLPLAEIPYTVAGKHALPSFASFAEPLVIGGAARRLTGFKRCRTQGATNKDYTRNAPEAQRLELIGPAFKDN